MNRSAIAHINLSALKHNLTVVKDLAPQSKVMCAVKANAYGHGLLEAAEALSATDGFAVAHIHEAIALREHGFQQSITVLQGAQNSQEVKLCQQHSLSLVIHHEHQLSLIESASLPIWLKVNTGMNRLGFQPKQVPQVLSEIKAMDNIELLGMFTHMADSDYASDRATTDRQLSKLKTLNEDGLSVAAANSATLSHWPESQHDWVRPGIMLYGVNPFLKEHALSEALKPVMSLSAPIIAINDCSKGEKVGYGGIWCAEQDSKIAVIAIGYGDGYPRHVRNGSPVLINGQVCPLVGRVSMDLITVDVTSATNIQLGDHAVLWGEEQNRIKKQCLPVEKVADSADTIAYELLCSVYGRVHYNYK